MSLAVRQGLNVKLLPIEILSPSVSHDRAVPEPQLLSRLGARGCL